MGLSPISGTKKTGTVFDNVQTFFEKIEKKQIHCAWARKTHVESPKVGRSPSPTKVISIGILT